MEQFVALHKELLKEEHQAELEECSLLKKTLPISELQNRGICIKKLHILSMKTGLYGRTIIKLGLRGSHDRPLPSHNFSSGDIVDLHLKTTENFSKPELQGVVMSVKETAISVALDGDGTRSMADELLSKDQSLVIFKTANEVTHRRLQKGLEKLMHHNGIASNLINVCFGSVSPTSYSQLAKIEKYYNQSLNDSQKEAIEFALSQREIAVIHGPPGTGKTTTIAELIAQLVSNGQKVLACTPSNVAIDNILEKLSGIDIKRHNSLKGQTSPIKLIRLGHPARILAPELHRLSLDAMIAKSDAAKIVQDVRKEIDNLYITMRKNRKKEMYKFREEKKLLTKELKEREKKAITEILSSADVILGTNIGAHSDGPLKYLQEDHFQVVIIDECGQALEASCWIPILQAPKLILAGDHLQLPPTVKSHTAASKWLSKSLLERITKLHNGVVKMLTTQYRMNTDIMKWSSDNLYNSKLIAHDSVKDHILKELPDVEENEDTITPILLIDTAGCSMPELQTIDNESIGNPGEAEIVAQHVSLLVDAGVKPKNIAVISPYNMQVDILRKLLRDRYKGLEIKSVDGFQGREKEAVVISLVRSNEKGNVGFLSDDRRMNVAVTRARRHLALICDSLTVGKHKFLQTLIDYVTDNGEVRSAHEFMNLSHDDGNLNFDATAFTKDFVQKKNPSAKQTSKPKNEQKIEKQDLEKIKIVMRKSITEFCQTAAEGGSTSYEFSPSLKAHERLAIHKLCEELKLNHESIGEGKERRIAISIQSDKISTEEECSETGPEESNHVNDNGKVEEETETNIKHRHKSLKETVTEIPGKKQLPTKEIKQLPESTTAAENTISIEETLVACSVCGRKLPPSNIQLHQLHCERLKAMKEKLQPKVSDNLVSKPKNASKAKKKKNKKKIGNENDKNDDDLLEEAIKANKTCFAEKCEQFVTVLGQICPFCKKTYCLEHHIPEKHGCGSAAHSAARRQICRDGVLYRGSGTPNKNLPPEKHANLQRKLDSKLKEMEGKRKSNDKKK